MKKIVLLLSITASAFAAHAQLHLTGASPYTQNFDGIGTSLPAGWFCYTGATSTSVGTLYSPWGGDTKFGVWADSITLNAGSPYYGPDIYGKGFKNSASADVSAATDTGGVQRARTNRALAVKQTNFAGYEYGLGNGGPAFVFHLKNTLGISNLAIQFQLQSLDYTNLNVTTWTVDAGISATAGATPTVFTPIAATGDRGATLTTGGYLFSNDTVTGSFGTALDNKATDVWIRIVNLAATTGGGTRTNTGIDDFKLTYTGTPTAVANVSAAPSLSLTALGESTSDKVAFIYSAEVDANYSLVIYDLSGSIHHTETIAATSGIQQVAVEGLHLAPGMYFAKMSNSNSSSVAKFVVR